MTEFDKAVKHVKTCLFWDFADGQWLDTLYTPLDRGYFNRLMRGVTDAHEAESAKLREELEQWHRLTAGIELPEYPITEFKPKDLERENAKLRKLIADIHALDDLRYIPSWSLDEYGVRMADIERRMRELGVEVDDA